MILLSNIKVSGKGFFGLNRKRSIQLEFRWNILALARFYRVGLQTRSFVFPSYYNNEQRNLKMYAESKNTTPK